MVEAELKRSGFGGITFSVRNDIRFGIRPTPYYQYDGPREFLEQVRSLLFKYGINASPGHEKLRITGINNCVVLADLLSITNEWAEALKKDFLTGRYHTEEGIKDIFMRFGVDSRLTYEGLCSIINKYKTDRATLLQRRVIVDGTPITPLPEYDGMYDSIDIVHTRCQQCHQCGVKIYFTGKYPREDNTVFLCDSCAQRA